jgi:hypothetical protein
MRIGLLVAATCLISSVQAPVAHANATGRFYVLACSASAASPGEVTKAGQTVVALRDAGFARAHLIASEHFPKLQKGFLVCVVDSSPEQKTAYVVSNQARNKGFKNYIALGW